MFKKLIFSNFTLTFIVIVCSGALMGTPAQNIGIIVNLLIILFFFILAFYFFTTKSLSNSYHPFYFYFLVLGLLPFSAAMTANKTFGQGIESGLIGNITFYNYLIFIYLYYHNKYSNLDLKYLSSLIKFFAWISLVTLYTINLFFSDLEFYIPSLGGSIGFTYRANILSSPFITWAGFIFLFEYLLYKKPKYIIYSLSFFSYNILINNGRIYFISLFLCLFIIYIKFLSVNQRVIIRILILIFIILIPSIIILAPKGSSFVADKSHKFKDAFKALTGNEVQDISANARLLQAKLAITYIDDDYLFGAGVLRSGTKENYIQKYFFPTDIGLLGVIFNYGFIGLTILLYQIYLFVKKLKSIIAVKTPFIIGTTSYLIFFYISSIATGALVYNIGAVMLVFSIVVLSKDTKPKQISNTEYKRRFNYNL